MVSNEHRQRNARPAPAESAQDGRTGGNRARYQRPTLRRLGTLTGLTMGGVVGPDDGLGGAGDDGSV